MTAEFGSRPETDLWLSLWARVEAMMERGQVFSEPESPSSTDRMLAILGDRKQAPAPSGPQTTGDRHSRAPNWLDLPSLPELLEIRRRLLAQQQRDWRNLESDSRSDTRPRES